MMEMEKEVQTRRVHGWAGVWAEGLVPQKQQATASDAQGDRQKDGWVSRHQSTRDETYVKHSLEVQKIPKCTTHLVSQNSQLLPASEGSSN